MPDHTEDLVGREGRGSGIALSVSNPFPLVANVAVARELSGWCWSLATM